MNIVVKTQPTDDSNASDVSLQLQRLESKHNALVTEMERIKSTNTSLWNMYTNQARDLAKQQEMVKKVDSNIK